MRSDNPNRLILRNRYGDSEEPESVTHPHITIGYVVNGRLTIHTATRIVQIYSGELFVLPRGIHFLERLTMEGRLYEEILFTPTEELLATIIKELQLFVDIHITPPKDSSRSLYPHQRASTPLTSLMNSTRAYLNNDIFERCKDMARMKTNELIYLLTSDGYENLATELLRQSTLERLPIEQFALHNILTTKTLPELAAEYGMSLSGFKKEFKRRLRQTPHRWFMERRLEVASRLLKTTDSQVKSIAYECQFVSTSHFIRLFHKHFQCTPTEYRTQHQQPQPSAESTPAESSEQD